MSRKTEFYQQVGQALRKQRELLGFQQQEVADVLGSARTSIVAMEGARQGIPLSVFYEWCLVLGTTPGELMKGIAMPLTEEQDELLEFYMEQSAKRAAQSRAEPAKETDVRQARVKAALQRINGKEAKS